MMKTVWPPTFVVVGSYRLGPEHATTPAARSTRHRTSAATGPGGYPRSGRLNTPSMPGSTPEDTRLVPRQSGGTSTSEPGHGRHRHSTVGAEPIRRILQPSSSGRSERPGARMEPSGAHGGGVIRLWHFSSEWAAPLQKQHLGGFGRGRLSPSYYHYREGHGGARASSRLELQNGPMIRGDGNGADFEAGT